MCEACEMAERVLKALEDERYTRAGADLDLERAGWGPVSAASYYNELYANAKQFWRDGSRGGLVSRMRWTIKSGLSNAFAEGAKLVGFQQDELTDDDYAIRDAMIEAEQSHIADFVDFMDALANSGQPLMNAEPKLRLWAKRFDDVRDQAKVELGKDAKLEWVYDPEKEHCKSCRRLNGVVKRASFWKRVGVMPKNPPNTKLVCGGWECGCELRPTDKPIKRGPLPRLP